MAYIFYNKPWESEFHGVVSRGDILQDKNLNQIKLKAHDTYEKKTRK